MENYSRYLSSLSWLADVIFGCICDGPAYFDDKNDMYKLYIHVSAGIFGFYVKITKVEMYVCILKLLRTNMSCKWEGKA